ncbi:MAG: ribonuclease III, partial [Bacilli bacterium]|nr:ribonuclease III [Bacilli bacterium]
KKDFLTEEEINVVKRARNAKVLSRPKRVDILTYKHATGLEALIGYLYVTDKQERINDILAVVIANADANNRGNVKNQ